MNVLNGTSNRLEPGRPLPLKVGFTDPRGRRLLGGAVEASDVSGPGDLEGLAVLVASADPGAEIVAGARDAGVPLIALSGSEIAGADLVTGEPPAFPCAPPFDPAAFNPGLFRDAGVAGIAALVPKPGPAIAAGMAMVGEAAHDEPVTVLAPSEAELPPVPSGSRRAPLGAPRAAVRRAADHLAAIDHPSFHLSELERAGWIAKLCAAGVPVAAAEISETLAALLGPELTGVLEPLRARDLADLDARERASVALRRAALRNHSSEARWRRLAAELGIELPGRAMVSVIFATRRESWLEHGIAQVKRQSYEPLELCVCLHGDEFGPDTEARVREVYDGDLQILRIDSELTLGDALNAGVEASRGELVTKMDDDDYYSTEHVWDLVLALEYSGADLVGKAAEFVYLEEIDVTVRQISHDVDTRMAGGGMMARKAELRELGGWPLRSRGEDLALIRRFADAGRPIRRIPPHGYILNRHGIDHTWKPQVDYFLFRSEYQWRGLGFDITAIEPPTDPYSRIPHAGA